MKVSVRDLINQKRNLRKQAEQFYTLSAKEYATFTDETGHHVYIQIRPTLKLYAPDNGGDAAKYYQVISSFTKITSAITTRFGGDLLEAQGNLIHCFFSGDSNDQESQNRLIEFGQVLSTAINAHVRPICQDAWNGYAMASDHGRAILVAGENDSLVSLGPCANNPAKRIHSKDSKNGVPSGEFHLRQSHGEWRKVRLISMFKEVNEHEGIYKLAHLIAEQVSTQSPDVIHLSQESIPGYLETGFQQPATLQAHIARADMHNFTRRVKEAFEQGTEQEIRKLAIEFKGLMQKASETNSNFQSKVIQFPWAGDCMNAILLASDEGYEYDRSSISADYGAYWHENMTTRKSHHDEVSWTIGCAGGGAINEANGYILIGNVDADGRSFTVVAGWGIAHSLKAQENNDANEYDTVIPDCDYSTLNSSLQKLFTPCKKDTFDKHRHYKSSELTADKVSKALILGASVQTVTQDRPAISPYCSHY